MGKGPDIRAQLPRIPALVGEGKKSEAVALLRSFATRAHDPGLLVEVHNTGLGANLEEESMEVLVANAKRFRDPRVHYALAIRYFSLKRFDLAATYFHKLGPALARTPQHYRDFAVSLANSDQWDEALNYAERAYQATPDATTAYLLGAKRSKELNPAEAVVLLRQAIDDPTIGGLASVLLGKAEFDLGEPALALDLFDQAEKKGQDRKEFAGATAECHFALGELDRAEAVVQAHHERLEEESVARFRAEVAIARRDLARARVLLDELEQRWPCEPGADGKRDLAWAQWHAQVGHLPEALQRLEQWAEIDRLPPRFSWTARLMGELLLRLGRVDEALTWLERARARNPRDPSQALLETLQARLGVLRSRPDAAPAESPEQAELRRLREEFEGRDREVRSLRKQLEASKVEIEAKDREHRRELESVTAPTVIHARVQEELEERAKEAAEKAGETVRQAVGSQLATCDPEFLSLLRLAESTYQTSLHTDLHPAMVAMHYCGALERLLDGTLAEPFDRHLDTQHRRPEFLEANVREKRGGTRVYHHRFVECFDPDYPHRSPGLGEWVRVLDRRREGSLEAFDRFLERQLGERAAMLDPLARFLEKVKAEVRDPAAHGKATEVSQEDLQSLRHALVDEWDGRAPGLIRQLLRTRT